MMNDVIQLVHRSQRADTLGDLVAEDQVREVFCYVQSVGQKEFYQAQALGLKPEIKFVLADYLDYEGETQILYDGQRYRVLRTYRAGQELEIVCYREVNPR